MTQRTKLIAESSHTTYTGIGIEANGTKKKHKSPIQLKAESPTPSGHYLIKQTLRIQRKWIHAKNRIQIFKRNAALVKIY